MKRIWLILAITAFACSKADLPTAPGPDTTIEVAALSESGTAIDSAKVFLDGNQVGFTPYQHPNVQPGLHAIRVTKDGFKFYTEQLLVESGKIYSVEAVLVSLAPSSGELVVTVNRDSAQVLIKDAQNNTVAETNERSSSHTLLPGTYTVSAEKSGYPMAEKTADVVAGKTTIVTLDLTSAAQPPTLSFDIAEDSLQVGESLTMTWQSDGYQVIVDQGIGTRGPNGSERVLCSTPGVKVFTATAYGDDNLTTQQKDTVYVSPKTSSAPTLEFSVAQDTVEFDQPALIEWESNGYQVVIDRGVGVRGPMGSEEVNFTNPGKKIFTAVAYGEGNLLTTRRDSVYVKEAPRPKLPVIMLTASSKVQVNVPATISWQSQNADYVMVDYVNTPDLNGSAQVTFSTPGMRIVTATAFNQAGYVTTRDTIEVVEPDVHNVEDIIILAEGGVRADKGEDGYYDRNVASFEVITAGDYLIYAEVWYNSGDEQLNESFYLQLRDRSNRTILPKNPNAGLNYVVEDDPGDPHTKMQESGAFALTKGTHKIDLTHYAKISNMYPQFLNGPIDGPESVKVLGFKIVYVNP